jgi:hypothetical protein
MQTDLKSMGIKELCTATDEIKPATLELPLPVVRKLRNQPLLSRNDFPGIKSDLPSTKTELGCVPQGTIAVSRLDQRLARHAPAQDTESSDFVTSLDDCCGEP